LLRALQESEVEPVGGRKPVKVDVRIISATNRDLIADVKAGRFREDLFYRLHVFPISLPPLRQRPEDIPELAQHFLARFSAEEGKRVRSISPDALHLLQTFRWPGNVRQLENAIFRAVVLADGEELGVNEFPQIAAQHSAEIPIPPMPAAPPMAASWPDHSDVELSGRVDASLTAPTPSLRLIDACGEVRMLDDIEKEVIRFAIAHYRGQMSEVARRLRIGRSTLYRKLEALGLDADDNAPKDNTAAELTINYNNQ
jgi:DNA-binding NtrC family response regulator